MPCVRRDLRSISSFLFHAYTPGLLSKPLSPSRCKFRVFVSDDIDEELRTATSPEHHVRPSADRLIIRSTSKRLISEGFSLAFCVSS
ncbi:hypothetical protein AVEN_3845-1 [Araneus ventricosus]|uniref:Uncharacterized protein n=1 Tax=Araneus ventricosus TaxID=182803 RepID=A0A4Y2GMJ0_ARAVE|nr:hypothetical protein AVEN_3845-1 [Araneus ventricosus]